MDEAKLYIVDDEAEICDLFQEIAEDCHFVSKTSTTGQDFKENYLEFNPDVITLDLHLKDTDGIELLRYLANEHCNAQIILISGFDKKVLDTAMQLGKSHGLRMIGVLHKPIHLIQIKELFEKAHSDSKLLTPTQLAKAIDEFQLTIHYQPKIQLATQRIVGVEALVRWQPPQHSMIFPDAFISLAEESGIIKPLSYWVIEKAFLQSAAWSEKNIDLEISINLSPKILDDLWLPDQIKSLAEKLLAENKNIAFEVTESGIMAQPKIFMDILTRMRIHQFSLSLDDFGTGYSSIVELHRLPFNELKIDKSFICNLETNEESQIIVKTIINLAHNLGLQVVAEGVETPTALKMLTDYDCDMAQGFYICKPLPIETLEVWLEQFVDFHWHKS